MSLYQIIILSFAFAAHQPKQDLGFAKQARFCQISYQVEDALINCDTGEIVLRLAINSINHPIGQKKVFAQLAEKYFPQLNSVNCSFIFPLKCTYAAPNNVSLKEESPDLKLSHDCLVSVLNKNLLFDCNSGLFQGPAVPSFSQGMVEAKTILNNFKLVRCADTTDKGPHCQFSKQLN